jgi:hypothetical protein
MRHAALKDDEELAEVGKAQRVPREQFFGTLRLFGDAIVAYRGQHERSGPYRLYPAILVSAWASFEAYVRIYSELFVRTAKNLPATISDALLEIDSRCARKNTEASKISASSRSALVALEIWL